MFTKVFTAIIAAREEWKIVVVLNVRVQIYII